MPQDYIDVPSLRRRPAAQAAQVQPAPTPTFEDVPSAAPTPAGQAPIDHTGEGFRELWNGVNPVSMVKGLYGIVSNLPGAVQGESDARGRIFEEAQAAFQSGDYRTGTRKFINSILPFIGPMMEKPANEFNEGRTGAAIGSSAAMALNALAPAGLSKIASARVGLPLSGNVAERAAVNFGIREGVPLDAATASGNAFVRGAQRMADETLIGSVVSSKAKQARAEGLATVGERLAARVSPAATTSEMAGQGVRDAVTARAGGMKADASTAYTQLRAIEARQPMAVDIAPTKAALKPIYDELVQENAVVPFISESGKAKSLLALKRLMESPDVAPLSIADGALSEMKGMARVDDAFRRTRGQGIAAKTVAELEQAVTAAAKQGGPDAFKALMDGRAATVNKYKAIEVLDKLPVEPVKLFERLTGAKDGAIDLLRKAQREAPKELPKLGRAYLDGIFEKARAEGGFGRTDGVFRDWQRLGAESKRMLFRDPGLVRDLDDFFLLAKRANTNVNPSGTAVQLMRGGEIALMWNAPATGARVSLGGGALSSLLNSPKAVRLMVRGLRVPLGNKAAVTAVTAELGKLARETGAIAPAVTAAPTTTSTP